MFPFHLGIAKYIQDNISDEQMVYGGVSGGAAVAAALAYQIDIVDYFEEALKKHEIGVFGMCDAVVDIMDVMFQKAKHQHIPKNKLLIQLASPVMSSHIVNEYKSQAFCKHVIRASAHIPVVGGLLPYKVKGIPGLYYDGGLAGMFPLIPDVVKKQHRVVNIDANGQYPNCDIHIGFKVPYSWVFIPRPPHILRIIFRLGYLKAHLFFQPLKDDCMVHKEIFVIEQALNNNKKTQSKL
jgi:hypothetical protein